MAQSVSFVYSPERGPVKDEHAPVPTLARWTLALEAVAELERQVTSIDGVEGIVLATDISTVLAAPMPKMA